jgi:hypothetical protein
MESTSPNHGELSASTETQRAQALEHFRLIRPCLEDGVALTHIAAQHQRSVRTVRRWVRQYRAHGLACSATIRIEFPRQSGLIVVADCRPAKVASGIYRAQRLSWRKAWPFRPPPPAASGLTPAQAPDLCSTIECMVDCRWTSFLIVALHSLASCEQHEKIRGQRRSLPQGRRMKGFGLYLGVRGKFKAAGIWLAKQKAYH